MTAPAGSGSRTLLASALSPEGIADLRLGEDQWETLWVRARTHCLTVYLHESWKRAGMLDRIPAAFRNRFAEASAQNTQRNLRILGDLDEILVSLSAGGVQSLVLKGLPLSAVYYGDIGVRVLYDIDFLVRPQDVLEAVRILGKLGYTLYPGTARAHSESAGLFWRPAEYSWDAEHVFDPGRPIFVELHTLPWEPHWHGFHMSCSLDLWDSPRSIEISGVLMRIPCEEDTVAQLAVHYACNALDSHARLMHLLDIALVLRRGHSPIRWDRVLAPIRASGAEAFCFLTLDLVRRVCGESLPESAFGDLLPRTPRKLLRWLATEGEDAAYSMDLYRRERPRIYDLHWAMANGPFEKLTVISYAIRSPWTEARNSGDWGGFRRRMALRARHMAAALKRGRGA